MPSSSPRTGTDAERTPAPWSSTILTSLAARHQQQAAGNRLYEAGPRLSPDLAPKLRKSSRAIFDDKEKRKERTTGSYSEASAWLSPRRRRGCGLRASAVIGPHLRGIQNGQLRREPASDGPRHHGLFDAAREVAQHLVSREILHDKRIFTRRAHSRPPAVTIRMRGQVGNACHSRTAGPSRGLPAESSSSSHSRSALRISAARFAHFWPFDPIPLAV